MYGASVYIQVRVHTNIVNVLSLEMNYNFHSILINIIKQHRCEKYQPNLYCVHRT